MEAIYCDTYPLLPNRLTYPELLPVDYHDEHIYTNESELLSKLTSAIDNIEYIRNLKFNKIAQAYDWSKIISIYDKLFLSLIKLFNIEKYEKNSLIGNCITSSAINLSWDNVYVASFIETVGWS